MKLFFYIIVSLQVFSPSLGTAKKPIEIEKTYIRVYNLKGKKIAAGKITFINDSVIGLRRSKKTQSFFMKNIGKIKTKKSAGDNVLKGALIGAGVGVATAIVTDTKDVYSDGDNGGVIISAISGAFYGAAVGGAIAAFKDSETFRISGNLERWLLFKETIVY